MTARIRNEARDIARLIGDPIFEGNGCRVDQRHGRVRRTANGECRQCGLARDRLRFAMLTSEQRDAERARHRAAGPGVRARMKARRPTYKAESDRACRARRNADPVYQASKVKQADDLAASRARQALERAAVVIVERERRAVEKAARAEQARIKRLMRDRLKARKRRELQRGGAAADRATRTLITLFAEL